MKISEKIKEELRINRSFRTYFDSGSEEFNQTELSEKAQTISRIISRDFDLHKLIREYKKAYNSAEKLHIYNNVSPTIIQLISYIKTGNVFDPYVRKRLENAKESNVIECLIETANQYIAKNFSLDKLIWSYLDFKFKGNPNEYLKQSQFYKIDFENKIDDKLYERFQNEKITDLQWSYIALNDFLKNFLFEDLYQNKITHLDPEFEMPITKGILYFIHKHFPKEIHQKLKDDNEFRRLKIFALAKELIEILYLNRKLFDFNVFFIRNNFKNPEIRRFVFENN